jgi:hypothetical protein
LRRIVLADCREGAGSWLGCPHCFHFNVRSWRISLKKGEVVAARDEGAPRPRRLRPLPAPAAGRAWRGKVVNPSFDAGAVLVRKEVAEAQLKGGGASTGTTGPTTPAPPAGDGADGGVKEKPAAGRALRRFYGSVELNADRPVRDLQPIIDSVIAELLRTDGVKLSLRLEIEATAPNGFDVEDAAIVRDNAKTLKFRPDATGFAEE